MHRHYHRGVAGPLILIAIGAAFLLSNMGLLSWSAWGLLRLWPLILMAIWIDLLIGRRSVLGTLVAGLLIGYLAAFFGDIALDAAVAKGFAVPPLEHHEEMAATTLTFFSVLAVVQLFAIWKKIPVDHKRAWYFAAAAVVGVALLIFTAYLGGHLVYDIGVNVNSVVPVK